MRASQLLAFLAAMSSLATALPTGKSIKAEREELYPGPDLGRIRVKDDLVDKREELYPSPDLGRIKVKDGLVEKREELYPGPDLGRIRVKDDLAEKL